MNNILDINYKLDCGQLYKGDVLLCNVPFYVKTVEQAVDWFNESEYSFCNENDYESQELDYLQADY